MVSESEKYGAGRSGYGGVDYASASWRAGDLERSRLQREDADARNRASRLQRENTAARNPPTPRQAAASTYSESSGSGFTVFAVLAFVVAAFYGIGEAVEYFVPNVRQEMLPYIGPDGLVSKNVFFLILVASLSTIGFLLRNILRWVIGIGLALAVVGGAIYLFLN